MSSIPRVFRLVAVLAIMTAGLAIPSAAHAVGGSPQFPSVPRRQSPPTVSSFIATNGPGVQCDTSAVEHSGRRTPDSVDWARR